MVVHIDDIITKIIFYTSLFIRKADSSEQR